MHIFDLNKKISFAHFFDDFGGNENHDFEIDDFEVGESDIYFIYFLNIFQVNLAPLKNSRLNPWSFQFWGYPSLAPPSDRRPLARLCSPKRIPKVPPLPVGSTYSMVQVICKNLGSR